MSIQINRIPSHDPVSKGENVIFYISPETYNCYNSSFKWYLDGNLVSTQDTFTTVFDNIGTYTLSVEVTENLDKSWLGGDFYGGIFKGNFSGGTFNYGNLNDCCVISEISNPKKFTSKI